MAFSPQGLNRLLNNAVRAFRALSGSGNSARPRGTAAGNRPRGTAPGIPPQPRGSGFGGDTAGVRTAAGAYAGDYLGAGTISYSPEADGSPDPGEIVWTWVPYQEDHSQGKDRPVLVIGS